MELKDKINLSVKEAADLFGIGHNTIRELAKEPNDFYFKIGRKGYIRREEFSDFLRSRRQFL